LALAKLKELYGHEPRPTLIAMGKELGYSKSTVGDNIKKLKEKGEL
jgi:DNA-binding MarR family transcriptional regulator